MSNAIRVFIHQFRHHLRHLHQRHSVVLASVIVIRHHLRHLHRLVLASVIAGAGILSVPSLSPAHAQTSDPFYPPSGAGLYLGASYGLGLFDTGVADDEVTDLTIESGSSLDEEDSAVSVFLGYSFDDSLAIEFFYTDLGELTASGNIGFSQFPRGQSFMSNCTGENAATDCILTIGVKSFGIAAKGSFRLADDLLAFIKGGYHLYETKYTVRNGTARIPPRSQSRDDSSAIFGVGFEYELNDQSAFMVGYDAYLSDLRFFYGGFRINLQPRY